MKRFYAAFFAVALSACAGDSLDPLPLSVAVATSPVSPAAGETVTFVTMTQGTDVIAIQVDFGDGATDGSNLPFVRTAKNTFKHAYQSAGSYSATFIATQNDSTSKSVVATVEVH